MRCIIDSLSKNDTHQSVSKLTKPGFSVLIEKGAGSSSHFSDAEYEAAGAKVVEAEEVWKKSDIVMKVNSAACLMSKNLPTRNRYLTSY